MKHDPFGNLIDWGQVLDLFEDLADKGDLPECQPGLIRILRYKGNWRLREEVLKRVGEIHPPSDELVCQVLAMLDDDNIYYDARILAANALIRLLKNVQNDNGICRETQKVIEKLKSTPQPPFFEEALDRLYSEPGISSLLKN